MEFLEELKIEIADLRSMTEGDLVVAASQIQISSLSELVAGEAGIPTGGKAIVMFNVSCPTGWTRVTAFDSKFIRGATTYGGTGGSNTHTHTGMPSHDHTGGTGADGHTHAYGSAGGPFVTGAGLNATLASGSGQTTGSDSHSHTISGEGGGTSTSDNVPAYVNVIFCSKD